MALQVGITFTKDTAKKTKKSKRPVERKAKIGAALKADEKELAGTPIVNNQKELLALA